VRLAGLLARDSSLGSTFPRLIVAVVHALPFVIPYSGGAAPELHRVPFSCRTEVRQPRRYVSDTGEDSAGHREGKPLGDVGECLECEDVGGFGVQFGRVPIKCREVSRMHGGPLVGTEKESERALDHGRPRSVPSCNAIYGGNEVGRECDRRLHFHATKLFRKNVDAGASLFRETRGAATKCYSSSPSCVVRPGRCSATASSAKRSSAPALDTSASSIRRSDSRSSSNARASASSGIGGHSRIKYHVDKSALKADITT
jgi:hypothetical protein